MKKEDPNNKQPEYTRYSEDEEQVLDLNELMDVQVFEKKSFMNIRGNRGASRMGESS